jgi:4-amino-4-deoxy-L-arabinose transferase-like glycosyltransferase
MRINTLKCTQAIVLCMVLAHCVIVLFVVISRINYRYELEWMEGASLVQAHRISTGQPLYVQPSLDYIPMIYPPLYFYLGAALLKISGPSFLPLRLVSFASTLGCLFFIFRAVKDTTKSVLIGLLAVGSFVATFLLGGGWFDIARVDMLFLFLCIAGVYFLGKQSTQHSIIAGVLFALALLTKQTALSLFVLMALSTVLLFRKQVPWFVGSFAIVTVIGYVYLSSSTQGWYEYYILSLPASHHVKWSFLPLAIAGAFKIVAVFVVISLSPLLFGIRKVLQVKLHQHYYFAWAGFIATSLLARINDGAYKNAFVPAYAGLAVMFGIGIAWLASELDFKTINKNLVLTIVWLAIGMQFVRLVYNPIQQIPAQADRSAGDALVADLRSAPGNVFIPYHNYLSIFAGQKTYLHMMTLEEVRGRFSTQQAEVMDVARQFNATSFSLIISDLPDYLIQSRQCIDTQIINYESPTTFYPVTGYHVRPTVRSSGCPAPNLPGSSTSMGE